MELVGELGALVAVFSILVGGALSIIVVFGFLALFVSHIQGYFKNQNIEIIEGRTSFLVEEVDVFSDKNREAS